MCAHAAAMMSATMLKRSMSQAVGMRAFAAMPQAVDLNSKLPDFDYTPPAYTGASKEEVMDMRKQYLNPGVNSARVVFLSAAVHGTIT